MNIDVLIEYFSTYKSVEEIFINGLGNIAVFDQSPETLKEQLQLDFKTPEEFTYWLQDFAHANGQRLDPRLPFCGGSLDDGKLRWHSILPPVADGGPYFCLRRHRFDSDLNLDSFKLTKTQTTQIRDFLLTSAYPLLICGPTGAGKSSLLSVLLKEFCLNERLCIIETVKELTLASPTWIKLLERPELIDRSHQISTSQLFTEALRLRPERLIIGEIRTTEELNVYAASSRTGHSPSIATLHAGSCEDVSFRLKSLDTGKFSTIIPTLNVIILQRASNALPYIADLQTISTS